MSYLKVLKQTRIDVIKKIYVPIKKTKEFIVRPNYKEGKIEVIKNKKRFEFIEKM